MFQNGFHLSHPFSMFSFQSRQSQLIHFMEDIKLRRENASGDEPELPELQVLSEDASVEVQVQQVDLHVEII